MRFLIVVWTDLAKATKPLFYERDGDFIHYMHERASRDASTKPLSLQEEMHGLFMMYSHIIHANNHVSRDYYPFRHVICENGFKLTVREKEEGVVFLSGCSADEGGDIEQMERRVNTSLVILKFLYGPAFDSRLGNRNMKDDERELEWWKISLLLNKWTELVDQEHSFLVEAVEELTIESLMTRGLLGHRCNQMFMEAFEVLARGKLGTRYEHAIHGMLVVGRTIVTVSSNKPGRSLNSYDRLLLLMTSLSYFPSYPTAEDSFFTRADSDAQQTMTDLDEETEEEGKEKTDSDTADQYYSGDEQVDDDALESISETDDDSRRSDNVSPIDLADIRKTFHLGDNMIYPQHGEQSFQDNGENGNISLTESEQKVNSLSLPITRSASNSPFNKSSSSAESDKVKGQLLKSMIKSSDSDTPHTQSGRRSSLRTPDPEHAAHSKNVKFSRNGLTTRSYHVIRRPLLTDRGLVKAKSFDDTTTLEAQAEPVFSKTLQPLQENGNSCYTSVSSPIETPWRRKRFLSGISSQYSEDDEVFKTAVNTPISLTGKERHASIESNESFFSAVARPKSELSKTMDPNYLLECIIEKLNKEHEPEKLHYKKDLYIHERVFLSTVVCDYVPHCLYIISVVPGVCLILAAEYCDPNHAGKFVDAIRNLTYLLHPFHHPSVPTERALSVVSQLLKDITSLFPAKHANPRAKILCEENEKRWRDETLKGLRRFIQNNLSTHKKPRELPEDLEENIQEIVKIVKQLYRHKYMSKPNTKEETPELLEKFRRKVRIKLRSYTEFMLARANINLPMSAFHNNYPGLVHFVYVNRYKNRHILKAPSLLVPRDDNSKMAEVLADMKKRLWRIIPWFYKQLSSGFTHMSVKDGDFLIIFELELYDDNRNCPCSLAKCSDWFNPRHEAVGSLHGSFYNRIFNKNDGLGLKCLELLTVHLAITPEEIVKQQRDELLHNALYERKQN